MNRSARSRSEQEFRDKIAKLESWRRRAEIAEVDEAEIAEIESLLAERIRTEKKFRAEIAALESWRRRAEIKLFHKKQFRELEERRKAEIELFCKELSCIAEIELKQKVCKLIVISTLHYVEYVF